MMDKAQVVCMVSEKGLSTELVIVEKVQNGAKSYTVEASNFKLNIGPCTKPETAYALGAEAFALMIKTTDDTIKHVWSMEVEEFVSNATMNAMLKK